ncbi:MAG: hypothetical protein H7267_03155 [Sandarakinorhabdus sp.]|nr:hypothetical protein [Sandarakinorhabdus sp.]
MAGAHTPLFLQETVVYLGAAGVLVPLFIRFRLGAVLRSGGVGRDSDGR